MPRFALAAIAALAAAGPAAAARYALVVGVSTYDRAGELPSLKYAEEAAVEVWEALEEQGYEVVSSPLTGRTATKARVDADLAATLARAGDGDVVVVYLAGHGLRRDGDPKTYFCPRDADPELPATLVALDEVQDLLRRSRATGGRVLLVDACRDRFGGPGPLQPAALGKADGVCTLCACLDKRKAFEDQKTLRRPVFTHHLLDALHGSAGGYGRPVLWADVAGYVKAKFTERGSNQNPDDLTGAGAAGAVLIPAARPRRLWWDQPERVVRDTQRAWARYLGKEADEPVLLNPGEAFGAETVLDMVLVPPGRFVMGTAAGGGSDEKAATETAHPVTLTRPFYIGRFEVTQRQYQTYLRNRGLTHPFHFAPDGAGRVHLKDAESRPIADTSDFPADRISYTAAREFCEWLTEAALGRAWKRKQTPDGPAGYDWECRLPTEAEWEYACRAGTTTAYNFGPLAEVANTNCYFVKQREAELVLLSPGRPVRAGVYAPNALGLRDMHGNVAEWCSDWFSPYPSAAAVDPAGPDRSPRRERVLRGGYFTSSALDCRSAARKGYDPASPDQPAHGFRVVIAPVARE